MIAKVTPANATIIYKRNGAQQANELQNDQELSLPPGEYTIKAEAEGFLLDERPITVGPGKEVQYTVALNPKKVVVRAIHPSDYFQNGNSWTYIDDRHWWTYEQKGLSFFKKEEGKFTFVLPRDTKPFLKEKTKKYEFVADYKDDDNKILYSIDPHHLTKKVFIDSRERKEEKSDTNLNVGETYRLVVQIGSDAISIRVNGATNVTKRPKSHGKFGFVNEIVLMPQ